jgi:hypothetical protein
LRTIYRKNHIQQCLQKDKIDGLLNYFFIN